MLKEKAEASLVLNDNIYAFLKIIMLIYCFSPLFPIPAFFFLNSYLTLPKC